MQSQSKIVKSTLKRKEERSDHKLEHFFFFNKTCMPWIFIECLFFIWSMSTCIYAPWPKLLKSDVDSLDYGSKVCDHKKS